MSQERGLTRDRPLCALALLGETKEDGGKIKSILPRTDPFAATRLKQARQFLATVEKTETKEKPKKNDAKIEPLRCPFCQKPTLIFVREVASERTHQPAKPLDSS